MLLKFPPWKVWLVCILVAFGTVLCVPNFFLDAAGKSTLTWWPTGPLKLGLDLKGGASLLLEVDPDELRHNELRNLSLRVREELRGGSPQIPMPADGRRLNPDTGLARELIVRPLNPADLEATRQRILKLGAPPLGAVGQQNSITADPRGDNSLVVRFTDAAFNKLKADALARSIEAVNRRVNGSGLVEPNVQPQGDSRIIVEVPGLDQQGMTDLIALLTTSGVLTFNMVDQQANAAQYTPGEVRGGRKALPSKETGALQVIFEDPIIRGVDLANASQGYDQSNRPSIVFQLHGPGAQRFGKETSANVGQLFAIVLDDTIISAPRIRSPITGGSGTIEGNFTIQEAENLANILRSGALPAKLKVASRGLIDASLGKDSIDAGVMATIVGIVAITIFMIATYGLLGLFATIAVYFNLILMMGVLSGVGATLTLPGIAGILLTMGMAVDANVLINERIRDEKKAGRSPVSSVDVGFDQAMTTIIDANATHLIAGAVMFMLGSGPVRGFAVTLAVGILTSLFTSVVLARFIFALWLKYARPKYVPI
jgi:preprotein translocase subunit SecD